MDEQVADEMDEEETTDKDARESLDDDADPSSSSKKLDSPPSDWNSFAAIVLSGAGRFWFQVSSTSSASESPPPPPLLPPLPPPPPPRAAAGEDPLEARFRVVLPNLLHAYVNPSSTANEREVTAVLKLLAHTARNFPGVFYHGKAAAVLPVVGRILPFLAEPAFGSRHGVIFETVGSLLSLLRTGEREAYRQFFLDAMELIEDILYVASLHSNNTSRVLLKCFSESFTAISAVPTLFELPACCRPADGPGVLVDLTDKSRWKLFAGWILKLVSKCLTEGTLYVEGLVRMSFVSSACSLLCFADAALHMACYDFARITTTIIDEEIIPVENTIRSITCILEHNDKETAIFRNSVYDSSMGACLHVLHSTCSTVVVESTAIEIINVFPKALQSTESHELQVALCNAYIRIAKICPLHIWRPGMLVNILCFPKPCFSLIECIRVAISTLASDCAREDDLNCQGKKFDVPKVSKKRSAQESNYLQRKRQKTSEVVLIPSTNEHIGVEITEFSPCEQEKQCASVLHSQLASFVDRLKPDNVEVSSLTPEISVVALSILCIAFHGFPDTTLSITIFHQVLSWIPWICSQVKDTCQLKVDFTLYLEAVHSLLLSTGSLHQKMKLQKDENFLGDANSLTSVNPRILDLINLLELAWSNHALVCHTDSIRKIKCLSIQIFSKAGINLNDQCALRLLDMALKDDDEEVKIEAVSSMPVIILCSGYRILENMFGRLELIGSSSSYQVNKTILLALGYLSCLYGSSNAIDDLDLGTCKLFAGDNYCMQTRTMDILSAGFWCPQCDKRFEHDKVQHGKVIHIPKSQANRDDNDFNFVDLQSLFFQFLYRESSEEFGVVCVRVLPRVLRHASRETLLKTRLQWIESIDFLLLHDIKAIREAFSAEISCFLEGNVLDLLFTEWDTSEKTKEQKFLDKIKHALAGTEDPQILVTLLESTAEIMSAGDIHGELFFYSLILFVDQLDNKNQVVRTTASCLIHRSCSSHLKGGFELVLSRFSRIRYELFEYLSARLVSRPDMIREFAEAVVGIKTEELIGKMVPFVIPKLVISHKDNDQAIITLHELANYLNMDVVPLIVNWLPKVLAFALLHANGQELSSVLQFYHVQTGSDTKEIFAAALPALLDELLCFPGEEDRDETEKRPERVTKMIQEVAKILTGSDDLPEFLKNHFVGLLNSIDRKLLHSDDLLLQKQALERIKKLIEMMGSYLSTHAPKIMVLLLHSIEKDYLQSEGLTVLHYFIKQLAKLSPSSTKHVISQVVAAFVPSLERCRDNPSLHLSKMVDILKDLVVENKFRLKQQIRELPLLPSIAALSETNKVIQEARGSITLRDQLQDAADGLNHESLNVRYMVACELSKLLNARREDVTVLIAGEAVSDLDVISSLITSLLKGCAEESRTAVGQRLKLVCADCLGALGAVDPAKFKGISCHRFKIECSDDDLIFELIHNHLARAFRAASDTIIQDSAALAIQELLKLAGCQGSGNGNTPKESIEILGGSNRGQRLWERFSNYVKEIIAPCLTSRFQLPNVTDLAIVGPIYRPTMSFRRWIYSWIRKLTVHASGSRGSIFSACRGIVRHDMPTARYLLPYLVLNAVCHGTLEERQSITEEILSVLNAAASENSGATVNGQSEVCIQAVFTLLDNLGQWVDDTKQELALSQPLRPSVPKQPSRMMSVDGSGSDANQLLIQCNNVSELLSAIPKVTLAKASFRCHAHARALMYFESHVRETSGSSNPAAESSGIFADEDISFLMEIYGSLDEPDGLSGLANLRKSLSLQDQLLINEKAGNWAEVLTFSEQALQMEPSSVERHSEVLNCLLNMCHLQAMITHVDGLISRIPHYKKTWCMQGVQAAWRLGRWDLMDEYLSGADKEGLTCSKSESNASFDIDLAKIIQAMIANDQFKVAEKLVQSKQALLVPLAAAGMDSYMRAYPYVVKLHMLCELEDFNTLLGDESFLEKSFSPDDSRFSQVMKDWDNRIRFTQPSLWTREPLLALRRLVFSASNLSFQVGNCWLQYAKLCRSAGHNETAHRAILEADASGAPSVHIEKAKLLWNTRKPDCAIAELQKSLLEAPVEILGTTTISSLTSLSLVLPNPASHCATQASKDNQDVAKTMLLYTTWIHQTGQKQKEDIINLYSRVREMQPKWEKGFFFTAKYYDDLLVDARKRQEDNQQSSHIVMSSSSCAGGSSSEEKPWWSHLPDVLLNYAKGLHRGHRHLFQALPRLLTLWFEFGSIYHKNGSHKSMKTVHTRVLCILRGCLKDLPTYQWLTVLSQLVSRICHQNEEIVRVVKHIITSVLQVYPQQALWMMAAVSKSTVAARRDAAAEIIQAARKGSRHGSDSSALFAQFASLMDHLIKLCFHPGQPKSRTINILTEFSALKRMMPLGIILPIQQALTVTLPSYDASPADLPSGHVCSVSDLVTISGIADEAEILSSLQRPKKNMIDGLGITGYEGIFLKVSEITLSVLRTHRETLMSVLETFIHDPLVEWTKSHKSSGVEVENPHAQRAISNIKARLQGIVVGVGAAPSLPLAVEGQARRLIAEAVSHKNLGKMYIWWMAWF
ncbi:uncharacterized protein A4U43_C06F11490 [Asparagus officinalis]|uniref:non-specific serine/threonine protein kinase n=1 Tax=Asparagus officinalis TaxID=4686 RepID=A0A5P1EM60_ASPOF|nr:uncharacterized protein A4U43_C06F11490 [Asparagus officinalis]